MSQSAKTTITLAVLAVLVLAGLVVGWRQLTAPLPRLETGAEQTGPCTDEDVEAGTRIRPAMVTVSVYNAGTRSGLADSTMSLFAERGFGRGETGNADRETKVRRAQVWVESLPNPPARLVASQLGPKTPIVEAPTEGVGIMVVVGDRFKDELKSGKRSVRAKNPTTICRPNPEPVE